MPHEQGHVLTPEQDQELQRRKKFLRDLGLSEDLAIMPGLEKLPTQAPAPAPTVGPAPTPVSPERYQGRFAPTALGLGVGAAAGAEIAARRLVGDVNAFGRFITGRGDTPAESQARTEAFFQNLPERLRQPLPMLGEVAKGITSFGIAHPPIPLEEMTTLDAMILGIPPATGAVEPLLAAAPAIRAGIRGAATRPPPVIPRPGPPVTRPVSQVFPEGVPETFLPRGARPAARPAVAPAEAAPVVREVAGEVEQLESRLVNIERQLVSGMPDELLEAPGGRRPFAQFEMPEGQVVGAMERLSIEQEQIIDRLITLGARPGITQHEQNLRGAIANQVNVRRQRIQGLPELPISEAIASATPDDLARLSRYLSRTLDEDTTVIRSQLDTIVETSAARPATVPAEAIPAVREAVAPNTSVWAGHSVDPSGRSVIQVRMTAAEARQHAEVTGTAKDTIRRQAQNRAENHFKRWYNQEFGRYPGQSDTPIFLGYSDRGLTTREFPWKGVRGEDVVPTTPAPVEAAPAVDVRTLTARGKGAVGARAVVPRIILREDLPKQTSILDYGAGPEAIHTKTLREQGFADVTAYDLPQNIREGVHDPNALSREYDVVMASNVLNVQTTEAELIVTLRELANSIDIKGRVFANYPQSPRKIKGLTPTQLETQLKSFFNSVENRGTRGAPVYELSNPIGREVAEAVVPSIPVEVTVPPVAPLEAFQAAAEQQMGRMPPQIPPRRPPTGPPIGPTPSEMDAIAEEVAGLPVMSDLSNFDEIVGIMSRPDVWRDIANLPVVRSIQRRFNPSAVANDPVTQSIVGRAMLRDQARQLTQRTTARLGAIGTQEQVFGRLTQEGLIADGPLKGLTVNTVRTYPKRYAAQTTDEMKEWIRVADDVEKAKLDYLRTNNIEINELAFDEGGQYAGRRVWGRYNSENDITAIGSVGAGPGRVGAKLGQEKERFFKTAEEAVEAGYRYIPDDEALYLNVQAAYNRVADERMADWLLERIDWRTTSMPEGVRIARVKAERRVALAKRSIDALHRAMRGESLPTGTVNAIERLFPQLEGRLREPTRIRIADVLKAAKALEQPERVLEVPSIGAIRKMQKLIQEAEDSLAANPLNPALQRKVSRLRSSLGFIRYRIGLGEPLTLPHNVVKELRRDALDDLRELRDAIRGTRVKRPGQATPRFEGGLIAEVRRELDEATKVATLASKQAKRISTEEGIVQAPAFAGKVFDAETARILRESLNPDFNKTLGSINQFNAVSRFFMLGGDASPFTIQLLFLAGGDPVVYGKAIGGFVNAMRSTRFQNKYLAKPENQAILAKYPNLVLLKGGATEYTEAMGRGGILSTQRALLPPGESALKQAALLGPRGIAKVGATMTRPFARGFEGAMDVAGIEMAKALDHHGTTPARIDDLTQFINEFRGVTSAERLGVSKIHQQQETASLLASRYTRAVSSLLFDIVHGGLRGQLARTAMARGVAAIAAMTVAVSYSMGEDEKDIINHLTPGHPMFMTWRIGGQNIGPGSKVRSIMNLFAKSAADPNKLRDTSIGWGALEYMKNPILRFYRAQAAPAISFSYDLLSGKDYIGDPTRDGLMSMSETVAKRFMWIWAQTMAFEGGTPLGRAGRGTGEFFGLRASPRNRIWEATDQWRPDMKDYLNIPTDPLERHSKGIKVDRTRYRQAHPEIDAKLWITGEVTTLKSSAASNIVRELVKQYEIDPVNIKGVQQHQKQKARMAELGVIRFTPGGASESQKIMDRLIRYLTMPEPVAQEPTPVPTGVPQ